MNIITYFYDGLDIYHCADQIFVKGAFSLDNKIMSVGKVKILCKDNDKVCRIQIVADL